MDQELQWCEFVTRQEDDFEDGHEETEARETNPYRSVAVNVSFCIAKGGSLVQQA